MTYNLFIGRYQSPHKGHMTIFNEYLDKGLPILIAIRDVEPDDKNPLNAEEVKSLWEKIYEGNSLVKIIVIPDISSVNDFILGVRSNPLWRKTPKANEMAATFINTILKSWGKVG